MTRAIEKLRRHHAVEAFDCGRDELNRFLTQYAIQGQQSRGAQTHVGLVDHTVAGYCALAVGSVEQEQAPERVKKGLAKHFIPIMLLARLAVDLHWQNQGIGATLVNDAVLRALQAADIARNSCSGGPRQKRGGKKLLRAFGFSSFAKRPVASLHASERRS
ncbi:MAG: hypothetical protein U0236_21035 [Nitrospira sp.]